MPIGGSGIAPTEESAEHNASGRSQAQDEDDLHIFGVSGKTIRYVFGMVCAAAVALFIGIVYSINIYIVITSGVWLEIVKKHFAAVLGLPGAALTAFFVVLLFSKVAGPIEVELLGMKFRGAATPVIFWIITFLAITLGVSLTWPLE